MGGKLDRGDRELKAALRRLRDLGSSADFVALKAIMN